VAQLLPAVVYTVINRNEVSRKRNISLSFGNASNPDGAGVYILYLLLVVRSCHFLTDKIINEFYKTFHFLLND
jgi:hypothetical protein